MAPQNVTAADFPPGYLEQYQGNPTLAVATTFLLLESLFVGLRFYARWIGRVKWGADDTLIIPGAVLCIGLCAGVISSVVDGGVGHHLADLLLNDPQRATTWPKFIIALPMIYLAAVIFPKLAILAIYLRIFCQKSYKIVSYIVAGVMIGNWIGTMVAGFFMCTPFNYTWDKSVPGGRCFDYNSYLRWASLANIITDVVMFFLPMPAIWKIQTTTNTKIGLTITFATGSLGLITSIIRFAGFYGEDADIDGSWAAAPLLIWTVVETGTYLIAACLPTYRPLAILLWRKAPLSFSHARSRSARQITQPQTQKGSHSISRGPQQKRSFTKTDDDSTTLVRVYDDTDPTNDVGHGLKSHVGHRHILVRSDYDVESRPRSNRQW